MQAYGVYKKTHWDGHNKQLVRNRKVGVLSEHRGLLAGNSGLCLTFPGSSPKFEEQLVSRGLVLPENIIGVQRDRFSNGVNNRALLTSLVDTIVKNSKTLLGMRVIAGEFGDISRALLNPGLAAKLLKKQHSCIMCPEARITGQMVGDIVEGSKRFSIVDADVCCSFDPVFMKDLVSVSPFLSDSGMLFITHQKGREQPSSQTVLQTAVDYVCASGGAPGEPLFSFLSALEVQRLVGIPTCYSSAFFDTGIATSLQHIIEYRDLNPGSGRGSGMLQLVFSFRKLTEKDTRDSVLTSSSWVLNHVVREAVISKHTPRHPGPVAPVYDRLYE